MKNLNLSLITVVFFLLIIQSCSKDERIITINLFASQAITQEGDGNAGEEIIDLLAPATCQKTKVAVQPKLIVHRLDIEGVNPQTITFPLSKAGEMRRKMNFLSFKHYSQEYKKNGLSTPNSKYLYQEGNKSADESKLQIDGNKVWYCCGQEGLRQFSSMESLIIALKDTLCQPEFDDIEIDILYNPNPDRGASPLPSEVVVALNQLGDANTPPEDRIKLVDNYLSMFSDNAEVKILGQTSGKIMEEPIAIKEYMERIAYFRSLDKIDVVETLKDDKGDIWEIRLVEYHN